MGLFVIIIGAFTLLCLGAYHELPFVVFCSGGVLAGASIVIWIDLWQAARAARVLIGDDGLRLRRAARVWGIPWRSFSGAETNIRSGTEQYLSSTGKSLFASIGALRSRLNIKDWELESAAADLKRRSDRLATVALSNEHKTSLVPEQQCSDEETLTRDFLIALKGRFRNSCAVVTLGPSVCVVGNQGSRFRQACQSLFGAALVRSEMVESEALALFGYRFGISATFTVQGDMGMLWLGYPPDRFPTDLERERITQVAHELEQALQLFRERKVLSERVVSAEAHSKSSSKLITEISHDIRSPLSNLKAILSVLKLEGEASDFPELLDVAMRNCDGLDEMVGSLIDFSRVQTGTITKRLEVVALQDILSTLAESFKIAASLKKLRFDVSIPEGEVFVLADRVHVRRIVTNLLSNAFKYTESGRVGLELKSCVSADGNTQELKIVVSDTGAGMTQGQIAQLFTPFTRFQPELAEGIGLGLTLTRSLVELNDGQISVRSEAGQYSEFTVSFPAHRGLQAERPQAATERLRVLLVDDDRDSVDTLARALSTRGIEAVRAYSVAQALQCLDAFEVEAIVSDAHMPFGGVEALLESGAVSQRALPVIVLTGDSDGARFLAQGAAAFIMKPVELESLEGALKDSIHQFREGASRSSKSSRTERYSEVA